MQVVKMAQKLRRSELHAGDAYDRVFCVYDRDEHEGFDDASDIARNDRIDLARSWPCFEFWFLLHFRYTRVPFARSGPNSPADACLRELKECWPEYAKNLERLFQVLRNSLEDAKRHAERAATDAAQTEEPNPSTEAHELVTYLQSLVQPR